VFTRRRQFPRKRSLLILAFAVVFLTVFSAGMGYSLWGDLNGGNTTATVVHVYPRTGYTIDFVTADGTACQAGMKLDRGSADVALSDTFEVHYSRVVPCSNVSRVDARTPLPAYLVPPGLLIVALIMFVQIRSRPKLELG
jgi:hypothetical protein